MAETTTSSCLTLGAPCAHLKRRRMGTDCLDVSINIEKILHTALCFLECVF
jgi:hypothetical protein